MSLFSWRIISFARHHRIDGCHMTVTQDDPSSQPHSKTQPTYTPYPTPLWSWPYCFMFRVFLELSSNLHVWTWATLSTKLALTHTHSWALTPCSNAGECMPAILKHQHRELSEMISVIAQLGAAANFDDLVKFGDRRQIRWSQMFMKLAFEFGCDVIFMSHKKKCAEGAAGVSPPHPGMLGSM